MDRHHTVQVSEMPYGIGMKPEYDMKPENKLKHEYEHEKQYVMNRHVLYGATTPQYYIVPLGTYCTASYSLLIIGLGSHIDI